MKTYSYIPNPIIEELQFIGEHCDHEGAPPIIPIYEQQLTNQGKDNLKSVMVYNYTTPKRIKKRPPKCEKNINKRVQSKLLKGIQVKDLQLSEKDRIDKVTTTS